MKSILEPSNWKEEKLSVTIRDASLKYLEELATKYHTEVEEINKYLTKSKYVVSTFINGSEKNNDYKLLIKATYYGNKSKHKSKNNSHRQEVSL